VDDTGVHTTGDVLVDYKILVVDLLILRICPFRLSKVLVG
jgi:hypothetical protein